jgi:hypothetical protein
MLELWLVTLLAFVSGQSSTYDAGAIRGVVLNGSRASAPVANAEVHLRVGTNGVFEPVEKTITDAAGRFSFENIPLDSALVFLPGASHHGVHYPGKRIRLDAVNKVANVSIVAYDAVQAVSPLTASRHDFDIEIEERVLKVTETLVVANQSQATYVGESRDGREPVTLRLSIPSSFDRVTFDSEFFGRRFRIVNHQLVTDMPWPPGEREVRFTYRVPIEPTGGQFLRVLDLPSSNVRVHAPTCEQQVSCNLSPATVVADRMIFGPRDEQSPMGFTIKLQIGNLPIPWMQYARWLSLAALLAFPLGTFLVNRYRNQRHRISSGLATAAFVRNSPRVRNSRRVKAAAHFARADRIKL